MDAVSSLSDPLAVLSFVGFLFLMLCVTVGGYVVLRWGTTGVATLWRFRQAIDQSVKDDFNSAVTKEN